MLSQLPTIINNPSTEMNKANINIGDCKIKILITQPLCVCFHISLMQDLRSGRCPRDIVYIYIFKLTKGFPYLCYKLDYPKSEQHLLFALCSQLHVLHCILSIVHRRSYKTYCYVCKCWPLVEALGVQNTQ